MGEKPTTKKARPDTERERFHAWLKRTGWLRLYTESGGFTRLLIYEDFIRDAGNYPDDYWGRMRNPAWYGRCAVCGEAPVLVDDVYVCPLRCGS